MFDKIENAFKKHLKESNELFPGKGPLLFRMVKELAHEISDELKELFSKNSEHQRINQEFLAMKEKFAAYEAKKTHDPLQELNHRIMEAKYLRDYLEKDRYENPDHVPENDDYRLENVEKELESLYEKRERIENQNRDHTPKRDKKSSLFERVKSLEFRACPTKNAQIDATNHEYTAPSLSNPEH